MCWELPINLFTLHASTHRVITVAATAAERCMGSGDYSLFSRLRHLREEVKLHRCAESQH